MTKTPYPELPRRPSILTEAPILVAVRLDAAGAVALRRTVELASKTGRRIDVVHVAERIASSSPPSLVELRAWVRDVTGLAIEAEKVHLRVGNALDEVRGMLVERKFALLVVGGRSGFCGPSRRFHWNCIARGLGVPVLAAFRRRGNGKILAATDLSNESLPAVEAAARLGDRLSVEVTLLHNATPCHYPWQVPRGPLFAHRRQALVDLVASRRAITRAVMTKTSVVDEAILSAARQRDVDLIVVAAHQGDQTAHARVALRTADRVVARARRSVLVVPHQSNDDAS